MTLSKLEIQQMLREMKVKFHADETYEALKQRLQQKNHSLWLESVSEKRTTAGGTENNIVRKRKKEGPPQDQAIDYPNSIAKPEASRKPAARSAPDYPHNADPTYRPQPIEKPIPGKPWKAAADGTEPFNRKKNVGDSVLRRARMCCEHCGAKAGEKIGAGDLELYHILPLSQGGEHSIKNVVALCPACMQAMANDPIPKAIKDLKRKTRSKIYDSLEVVRKKPMRARKRHPGRRK